MKSEVGAAKSVASPSLSPITIFVASATSIAGPASRPSQLRRLASSSLSPMSAPVAPPAMRIGGPGIGGASSAPIALRQIRASSAPSTQMPGAPSPVWAMVLQ